MKERPIIFSSPMVKALLADTKSQTRRVVKPTQSSPKVAPLGMSTWWVGGKRQVYDDGRPLWLGSHPDYGYSGKWFACPYGGIGDQLWVREIWAPACSGTGGTAGAHYKADHLAWLNGEQAWKPSIFMPRWASRITLEISDVRVEQVQSISDSDLLAEGVDYDYVGFDQKQQRWSQYMQLWDTLNGKKYPWSSNPFCWVLEFRRV